MEFVADILYDLPKNYGHVFDLVHFILCIQGERSDMTEEELKVLPKKHPFALWLSSMMICFAGGILLGPLAGESALDAMEDGSKILMATL
ncbi:Trimeric intracellular cation channel type B, partial [Caligus rogercresseyi]